MRINANILAQVFVLSLFSVTIFGQKLDYLPKDSFYRTYKKHTVQSEQAAHLPVQPNMEVQEEFFYQRRENTLQPLLVVMNSYLDSLKLSVAVTADSLYTTGSPYIFVGSSEAETAPPGSEMIHREHDKFPPVLIYAKNPSKKWKRQLQVLLPQHCDYLLIFRLGFSGYPKANKGLFGKKVVLGTNYEHDIRVLSAEDKPVEVLQLTGVLLNRNGEILKAGAEGIIHEDTPFWAQVLEVKKGIADRAIIELVSNHRREDLPGRPLAWQQALHNLITNLLAAGAVKTR